MYFFTIQIRVRIYHKKSPFLVIGAFLDLLICLIIPVIAGLQTSSVTCEFLDVEAASDSLKKTQTITVIF
jgi:hypothetical protein